MHRYPALGRHVPPTIGMKKVATANRFEELALSGSDSAGEQDGHAAAETRCVTVNKGHPDKCSDHIT